MIPYRSAFTPLAHRPRLAEPEPGLPEPLPMPRGAQFVQNMAVIFATTSATILTVSAISKKDSTLEVLFKVVLSAGLVLIGGTTALYEFSYAKAEGDGAAGAASGGASAAA